MAKRHSNERRCTHRLERAPVGVAASASDRREQQQALAGKPRSGDLSGIVNTGRLESGFVEQDEAPASSGTENPAAQPGALAFPEIMAQQQDTSSRRQPSDGGIETVERSAVGDQPFAREPGLAAVHDAFYSA